MFKKKIIVQLTTAFVVVVMISMIILGSLFLHMFRSYAFESRQEVMLQRAQSIAEIMGEYTSTGSGFRGLGGFMRFLNTMTDSDVWITDAQGEPLEMSGMGMGMGGNQSFTLSSGTMPQEAVQMIQDVLLGQKSVSQSFSSVYNEATLTVGVPIMDKQGNIEGAVLLHAPVTGVTQTMDKARGILMTSLLVAFVVAVSIGIFYSFQFIIPLKQMNQAAMEMAHGNYEIRSGVKRQDELGQLGDGLDFLASKLNETVSQLHQEKGKLGDIIASISEGIISFDRDLKPLNVNSKLSELMNYGKTYDFEAIKRDFKMLDLESELKRTLEKKIIQEIVKSFKGKQLKFTLAPILDNRMTVTGVVASVQDISESEKLEALRRAFVANVSHEFRTPLTVIKGSLEALSDGTITEPEAISKYMTRLLAETRSLERLVADLLEMSSLQSEGFSVRMESVYLPDVSADVVKGIQSIAKDKGIEIETNVQTDIPLIQGDYDRLRQLFVIFLDNAIRYSKADTSIQLSIRAEADVEVSIKDQGIGIAAEEVPYIWDRFYQSDRSRKNSGTGLGLSIAKRLIELHGATVSVESELGKGTVFTVRFPIGK